MNVEKFGRLISSDDNISDFPIWFFLLAGPPDGDTENRKCGVYMWGLKFKIFGCDRWLPSSCTFVSTRAQARKAKKYFEEHNPGARYVVVRAEVVEELKR